MKDSKTFGAPSAPSNTTLNTRFPDVDYPIPLVNLYAPPYSAEESAICRDKFVTKQHTIPEKMLLYNSSTQGKLDDLK